MHKVAPHKSKITLPSLGRIIPKPGPKAAPPSPTATRKTEARVEVTPKAAPAAPPPEISADQALASATVEVVGGGASTHEAQLTKKGVADLKAHLKNQGFVVTKG